MKTLHSRCERRTPVVSNLRTSRQAGATSGALEELARTIQQEMECLEEATRLSSIVTGLQVGGWVPGRSRERWDGSP